jgi:hypothetical protein
MNDGPGTEMDDAVEDQSPSVNDFVTKVVDTIATSVRYFLSFLSYPRYMGNIRAMR